jgi:YfiH family protein
MFFEKNGHFFIGRFASLFRSADVFHGISTRKGGVSSPPYDTLNLGKRTDDTSTNVEENRRRFYSAMAVSSRYIAIPRQVHSNAVAYVSHPGIFPETDGLVTDVPGIALVVQVADCLPIFLYDTRKKAIGLVHAGWKGMTRFIVRKAVEEMVRRFHTHTQDLRVYFGPSIGPCCYEVQDNVASHFLKKYVPDGKLNLWTCAEDQLVETGVQKEKIEKSGLCTVCLNEWFFSHRASGGKAGRMMAVFGLAEK